LQRPPEEKKMTEPALPTTNEVEAAARILDREGRFHNWWPLHLKPYDELSTVDPIAKEEFDGIVYRILLAASQARSTG
jgi:hypothetical protein